MFYLFAVSQKVVVLNFFNVPSCDWRIIRVGRRRSRRGIQNNVLTDIFRATSVIRSILKNLAIIWIVTLGIFGLFSLPSFLGSKNYSVANQNVPDATAEHLTNNTPVATAGSIPVSGQVESREDESEIVTAVKTDGQAETTQDVDIENVDIASRDNAAKDNTSDKLLSVGTFQAVLFKEVDSIDEVENSDLAQGDQLQQLGKDGDWLKVKVVKNGISGYIHYSQIE